MKKVSRNELRKMIIKEMLSDRLPDPELFEGLSDQEALELLLKEAMEAFEFGDLSVFSVLMRRSAAKFIAMVRRGELEEAVEALKHEYDILRAG